MPDCQSRHHLDLDVVDGGALRLGKAQHMVMRQFDILLQLAAEVTFGIVQGGL